MSTHRFDAMDGAVQSRQIDALSASHRSHLMYTARMAEREREPIPLPALQVSNLVFRLFNLFSRRATRRAEAQQRRTVRLPRRVACTLRPAAC
mgnify:CR=1 FL=1